MNLLELIKERHSVRQFSPKEVEEEKLNYILECARLAPSAANYQPWKFYVVKDKTKQQQLKECYKAKWFTDTDCTYYIVACGDTGQSWKRSRFDNKDHCDIDISIAAEHLFLAAVEQGLCTCWICAFDPDKCKEVLNLAENVYPLVIFPIGYPDEKEVKRTPRKEINEIVEIL